jgi:ammonium transporter, Amt family
MDFLLAQELFPEQITTDKFAQNLMYIVGAAAALVFMAGLMMVDIGTVRRKNVLDVTVQRLVGFFIGAVGYYIIGHAIWNWQYYVAFGVPDPYWTAIEDWWLGGTLTGSLAQQVDPVVSDINNSQIFLAFLALYAGLTNVLVHFALAERVRPRAYYIMSAIIGTISFPVCVWLTWGSTSPITNAGTHDFFGVFAVYIFAGTMCLLLARRVGPRIGIFTPDSRLGGDGMAKPYNLGLTSIGVMLILIGVPLVVIACGFFFPEEGYFGIAMSTTSIGLVFENLFAAMSAGAVVGAIIAYRTKKVVYALLAPLAGYISAATGFDVMEPWEMFLVGAGAPIVAYLTYEYVVESHHTDEHKVIPLGLGVATYGVIMTGLLGWGTPTGGFFGLTEGEYAFQNAEVNILWQLVGIAVVVGIALLTYLVTVFLANLTGGLRVSEAEELEGGDIRYWEVEHDIPDVLVAPATPAPGGDGGMEPRGVPLGR